MLFNSMEFIIFLVIVWLLYILLRLKLQNLLLLVASYVFYGWWDWRFLSLLAISTVVDFHCAKGILSHESNKKLFLLISILTNLSILGFFKYFNFFIFSFERLLNLIGFQPDFFTLSILLPVGISFYTFQTLGYTIDVYRGKTKVTTDFVAFAVYVSYFPQLVAGPIERASNLLPKIQTNRYVRRKDIKKALQLMLTGYFKKVFIADGVAPIVDQCFSTPDVYGGIALILGSYLFAMQIYGDFAGYTDIARGVSRLFGIELCLNFRQPYLSSNVTEFWRRWHISLSTWLRDYLYIPLGGNRKGIKRTYVNNMLTMLIGGLWHGAGWNFIIWGGLHGFYLAVHKFMLKNKRVIAATWDDVKEHKIRWWLKIFFTFNLICIAWIFFRSNSLSSAVEYLSAIVNNPFVIGFRLPALYFLFYGSFIFLIDVLSFMKDDETIFSLKMADNVLAFVYGGLFLLLLTIGSNSDRPFIYFQF